jgi:hypothetical protein
MFDPPHILLHGLAQNDTVYGLDLSLVLLAFVVLMLATAAIWRTAATNAEHNFAGAVSKIDAQLTPLLEDALNQSDDLAPLEAALRSASAILAAAQCPAAFRTPLRSIMRENERLLEIVRTRSPQALLIYLEAYADHWVGFAARVRGVPTVAFSTDV